MPDPETGISILIVEDESIVALDISDYLEQFGYRIAGVAADAETAVAIFREEAVDLVLMDIHLRGHRDGIETARQLRAIRPAPLIYLTAQADIQTTNRAKLTEPSAYLLKPFDERSLKIAIDLAFHNFTEKQLPATDNSPDTINLNADALLRNGNHLFIKQQGKFVKINLNELLYCKADGIYTDLVSVSKKYALRLSLTHIVTKLSQSAMVRIHRSYAVNLDQVDSITEREVSVADKLLPIGSAYKEDFLRRFDLL